MSQQKLVESPKIKNAKIIQMDHNETHNIFKTQKRKSIIATTLFSPTVITVITKNEALDWELH